MAIAEFGKLRDLCANQYLYVVTRFPPLAGVSYGADGQLSGAHNDNDADISPASLDGKEKKIQRL